MVINIQGGYILAEMKFPVFSPSFYICFYIKINSR